MVKFPYLAQHRAVKSTGWSSKKRRFGSKRAPRLPWHAVPLVHATPTSIHNDHVRVLKDLPVGESSGVLKLRTKRNRCRNPDVAIHPC